MTKAEIKEKLNAIINKDCWLVLYYKGFEIGVIELNNTNGETEKNVLDKLQIIMNKDNTFSLWVDTLYGYCYYVFDDCKIKYNIVR